MHDLLTALAPIAAPLLAAAGLAYALQPGGPVSAAGETDPQDWPPTQMDRAPGIRVVPGREPE